MASKGELMATQSKDASMSNTQKDPSQWKTGDEPMTGAQRSYLETLSEEVGESADTDLTKAEASKKIDDLRHKSPRVNEDANNGTVR
jgi:hypothetical protein